MFRSHAKAHHHEHVVRHSHIFEYGVLALLVTMVVIAAIYMFVITPPKILVQEKSPLAVPNVIEVNPQQYMGPMSRDSQIKGIVVMPEVTTPQYMGPMSRDSQITDDIVVPGAPSSAVPIEPVLQRLDIGGGNFLELTETSGRIVAPTRPSTAYQKIDLGSGMVLEITGDSARIISPPVVVQPTRRIIQKLDLGAGYTLNLYASDGEIVAP
jgi:hypothetical protein